MMKSGNFQRKFYFIFNVREVPNRNSSDVPLVFCRNCGEAVSVLSLQCMHVIFCSGPSKAAAAAAAETVIRAQKDRWNPSMEEEFFLEQEAITELILKAFDQTFPHFFWVF